MPLSIETVQTYVRILQEEMLAAMGCTEPIAIAYAASVLRATLGCEPTRIEAGLSGNIIKNVKSVIVPATGGMHGIEAAVAAGIVANRPDKRLEVLSTLTPREAKVLELRFGLRDGRQRTLEDVGKEFNVTRERIRQIESKALRKLRHPSRSRKLKDFLDN